MPTPKKNGHREGRREDIERAAPDQHVRRDRPHGSLDKGGKMRERDHPRPDKEPLAKERSR